MKRNFPPCLTPGCKKPPLKRGLCAPCHTAAARLVFDHKTTWKKLEQAGFCTPVELGCLAPECSRIAIRRGLCQVCYDGCRNGVAAGKFTWSQLELEGRCGPSSLAKPNHRFCELAIAAGVVRSRKR